MLRRYYIGLGTPDTLVLHNTTFFNGTTTGVETSFAASYTVAVKGLPGSTLTIKVSAILADPSGSLTINSVSKLVNDTFTVTVDGSGNGSFAAHLEIGGGTVTAGQYVRAILDIVSVTTGAIDISRSEVQLLKSAF